MRYDGFSDEKMIDLIQEGDKEAVDFLLNKYKPLVRKKAKTLYLTGGDKEDIIQEGMIGLYKAVRDYKSCHEVSFFTFAQLCISRQIYTAISSSNTKKNQPLNHYISFELSRDEKSSVFELLSREAVSNPEEEFIDKERTAFLHRKLMERLSKLEKQVIELSMKDYNYLQIAKILKKNPKSTDNALQRIRRKFSQVLEEN